MLVQIVGALLSGSLALLADAAHMFTDASGLVIALIAATVAARPADDRRTFGYQRAEVFGALINAVILIALATWVAIEGIGRLIDPGEVEVAGGLMLIVAVVGMLANAVSMWLLSRAQRTSINVRGCLPRGDGRSDRFCGGHRGSGGHPRHRMDAGRCHRVAVHRGDDHPSGHRPAAGGVLGSRRVRAEGHGGERDPYPPSRIRGRRRRA